MDTVFWKNLFTQIAHFLMPDVCMVCGRVLISGQNSDEVTERLGVCRACLSKLPVRPRGQRWFPCLSDPYESDPVKDLQVWVGFHYEMPVTSLLRRLKFSDAPYCGTMLGSLMGSQIRKDLGFAYDCVIPIPLSSKRLKQRGYNQAAVIAMEIARELKIPLLEDVLIRIRHTGQQSRITDPQKRQANMTGAFAVKESWDISGWNILLVDDILTTGATLHEAAQVLNAHGAKCVSGAVCASHREVKKN